MRESTPKYVLVQQYIEEAINKKQLVDKLPGERTLAKELGFSYMTVRKAVDILVSKGVLYKIPTKGTFVDLSEKKARKNRTIGYFLDSSIKGGIAGPYYSMIFNAIEKEASKNDYSILYFTEISEDRLENLLTKMDGVIATCFPRMENIIQEIKQHLPVVVIDNSAADKSIPSVIVDNFSADIEAVDCLCKLGHKNIGFMSGLLDSEIGSNRYAGFQSGLSKSGIELDEALVFQGDYSFGSGVSGADYFLSLEQRPTAILCANDSMALGAIQRFTEKGLAVPGQISVIGFDDIAVASQISPALTTVAVPIEEIARHSFSILNTLIQGKQPAFQHISLPAHLVKRQTCHALDESAAA